MNIERLAPLLLASLAWSCAADRRGPPAVEPFRIAGNLYYVGTSDVTAFLLAGPEGHVLIDGGDADTAHRIQASIGKLGFSIADVRVLLNSHGHFDHAGGLAALQRASGAALWISEGDADVVAAGGAGDPTLARLAEGRVRYPAPRVDHRFRDGATIRLGPLALTAHVTAGHTRGCTSWSFPVVDGGRALRAVSVCSLSLLPGVSLVEPETYPGIRADFERSFVTLRALPADLFLGAHAGFFDLDRKLRERSRAGADPVAPFLDRDGYLRYLDEAESRFRRLLAEQGRP
jgi:metallo-beta-lactamase class B